jgi:hypothetical protein
MRDLVLLKRQKEDEIWEQTWNGRRIKNIAIHRETISLFDHEQKHKAGLIRGLTERNKLLGEIACL